MFIVDSSLIKLGIIMKRLLFLSIFFLLFSCKEKNDYSLLHNSKYLGDNVSLEILDSIQYNYLNNEYIGRIANVISWNDYILFFDVIKKQVAIFDENFSLIKKIGGEGRGPGEFTTLPMMILGTDTLMLFDTHSKNLFIYNDDLQYTQSLALPSIFIYQYTHPAIKFNNSYIFSITFPEPTSEIKYFTSHSPLVILNNQFEFARELWEWDDIYQNDSLFTYASANHLTYLTKGEKETFFATQSASHYIYQFDSNYHIIKKFGRMPLFFKKPPRDISVNSVQKSYDSFLNYTVNTTIVESIEFDETSKLLFKIYYNPNKLAFQTHDSYEGERYLQVYDSNFNVIFDDKIYGIFLFSKNGIIYILEKETPEYFLLKKYQFNEY